MDRRLLRLGLAGLLLAGLQACQTARTPAAPGAPSAPGAEPSAPPAKPTMPPDAPLAAEARWLGELFEGTPVKVSGERDGSVQLIVPMQYAFDASAATAAAPKPPLQAVLDKLSQSLKRQPTAKLQASPPAGAASAERLAAIRTHLAARGVPAWRLAAAGPAPDAQQLLLRLVPPPSGLRRLDDSTLGPSGTGRVLPPAAASAPASPARR
ncbi:hypothetical protein [Ideonella sp.]|uniref:hypothetical protein n=1 Tax=Ideonella sp. TaxID=1929293 RepID=UPI002B465571|nr:hypothetical protein [Ideonella sp.]HJV69675.1 hypothetical protein [Ideonella sp.]